MTSRGVPKRFIGCRFSNYNSNNPEQITLLKSYNPDDGGSLFITGRPGSGKTHLTVALLCHYSDKIENILGFSPASRIMLAIRGSFKSESTTEASIIKKYCSNGLLVIDDIGTEKVSEYVLQCWYEIIDGRYAGMLPTIYTSNLSIEDVSKTYGDRLASRLAEGLVVNIKAKDYRLSKETA